MASYQYADLKAAVPMANYSTQPDRAEPGLNIAIRQPIPFFMRMSGHVEATAEMRNMLAQGYLPLEMADGRQILIVNNPRVFRERAGVLFSEGSADSGRLKCGCRHDFLPHNFMRLIFFMVCFAGLGQAQVNFKGQVASIIYKNCSGDATGQGEAKRRFLCSPTGMRRRTGR